MMKKYFVDAKQTQKQIVNKHVNKMLFLLDGVNICFPSFTLAIPPEAIQQIQYCAIPFLQTG